jgi:pimeloyl-ACP methyl ester carboxylesterase
MKIFSRISLLVLSISSIVFANIIYVPTDQPSIQAGINAAVNGDTVLVADSTYIENIHFNGKSILVSSHYLLNGDTTHISNTIIDGSQPNNPNSGSVVFFISGEDTTSVLNGFTITGGSGSNFSSPWQAHVGGGIYINGGAKVINNKIINNSLFKNSGQVSGGGIFIYTRFSPQNLGNVIIKNNHIENNVISGNFPVFGGGITVAGYGYAKITSNKIYNNSVIATNPIDIKSGGGGIFVSARGAKLFKNLIINNYAPQGGGLAAKGFIGGYSLQLINNTIANNDALFIGGGAYLHNGRCDAINNIFWDNTAPDNPDIFFRGDFNLTYSITQDVFSGTGNIQTNPLFENTDYHLSAASPAIDAGNPDLKFYDIEDPNSPGMPLWPAMGNLTADMGAFGGNDTVSVTIGDYPVQENFLYSQFSNMYYRYAYPLNYDSTSSYPLTVVLHGYSQWGSDNEKQLNEALPWRINAEYFGHNEFTIAPQAPTAGWDGTKLITVHNLIRYFINNYPIDTTKIVITGYSNGGGGSWRLLNLYPELFSALIAVSTSNGGFANIKHTPVWLHHGTADNSNNVSLSREYVSYYENTGLTAIYAEDSSDVQINNAINNNARLFYSEYIGAGHIIVEHAYNNSFMFDWLNNQTKPLVRPISSHLNNHFLNTIGDSIIFTTKYSNPHNFQFNDTLIIENFNKEEIGKLSLYDDGLHGDSLALDGIWGNYISSPPLEDNYRVGIKVKNTNRNSEFYFHDLKAFTTIGPVNFVDYAIVGQDTIPNHGDYLNFVLTLKNNDQITTAENISAKLSALDSCANVNRTRNYGNILADSSASSSNHYPIRFTNNCPDSINVPFQLDISSNGYVFWTDTFSVFIYKDPTGIYNNDNTFPKNIVLKQNYPNPFNPKTIIKYTLPNSEKVKIKVFNLLGQKITTLINKLMPSGSHEIEFNAKDLPSGVYLYRIEAGSFIKTRKLILMK